MPRTARPRRRPRSGFTLIELLVVITIIGLLVALLIPAIAAAVKAARAAAVQTEINTLGQALADFKSKYGDYPPSRIILFENGNMTTGSSGVVPSGGDPATGNTVDISFAQLEQRSITAMRKFWPKVKFVPGGLYPTPWPSGTPWYDYNGNAGTGPDAPYVLQGHECLVFFLGGIPLVTTNGSTTSIAMTGFGKNPTNPFTNSVPNGNASFNANRNPPLFEFSAGRLQLTTAVQKTSPAYGATLSGIPGYVDSLNSQSPAQNFYAYFSTNVGAGYDPNDVNFENSSYDVGNGPSGPVSPPTLKLVTASSTFISPSPNPYTTGTAFINPQTFQIISPGADGAYGVGGIYAAGGSPPLPTTQATSPADTGLRLLEKDNLTNFHNGRLE